MEKFTLTQYPKVQAEFEAWFSKKFERLGNYVNPNFYLIEFLFQQGVYEAYFRSVGIYPSLRESLKFRNKKYIAKWEPLVNGLSYGEWQNNPIKAKTAALEEAAKIREEQLTIMKNSQNLP